MLHQELSKEIIGAFYHVFKKMGSGHLEKVYEEALLIELRKRGLKCEQQVPIIVYYEGHEVGYYYCDICVEGKIIIELKTVAAILEMHECQLVNYLKSSKLEIGLLLNFGPNPSFKRKIYSNELKSAF